MEYVVIGIVVVFVVVLGSMFWYKCRKNKRPPEVNTIQKQDLELNCSIQMEDKMEQLIIHLEQLPAEAIPDEIKLVEITDKKVLHVLTSLFRNYFTQGMLYKMLSKLLVVKL